MATLTIQNLPDLVHSTLHQLAAQDGLSIEEEVCLILSRVCALNKQPAASLQDLIAELYQGKSTSLQVEQLLEERKSEAKNEWSC